MGKGKKRKGSKGSADGDDKKRSGEGNGVKEQGRGKGARKGGGGGGGSGHSDKFLWHQSEQKTRTNSDQSATRRYQSYTDKLKSGEKKLNNMRDAQQLFRILSRDYKESTKLVLHFDERMEPVLQKATNLLYPDNSEPLKLLAAMGEEGLMQGVYKERTLRCFKSLYEATDFMLGLTEQLTTGRLQGTKDHSTIAWFLLQLGKSGNEEVLENALVREQIRYFKTSKQVGFPLLSNQLDVVFHEFVVDKKLGVEVGGEDDDAQGIVSLKAAQRMMRPPGSRDHDNDKECFRAISIVPTVSELQCTESAYLPPASGSTYLENTQAIALDRQFRLMREDLIGTVKEELKAEFSMATNQRRRMLPDPHIVDFGMKPEPHVVIRVSIPYRLEQRIKSMKNPEASKFFDEGQGKRTLQKGTLVLLVHDASENASHSKSRNRDIQISAVGTVVERKSPMKIVQIKGTVPVKSKRVLEVGVNLTPDSMKAISPLLQKLKDRKEGVSMVGRTGALFNASAGMFSLQPILKALVRMDQVPMYDQLIHLKQPSCPSSIAHSGKTFNDLSIELQKAVASDQSQKRALEEVLKSNTVLVQGPPGTGKTYIGVQAVKAMLELNSKSPCKGRPLRILCLCYTNHALDSFLLDLIKAGVPKDFFIRLGYSPKIDPKIKARCLGEVEGSVDTKFGSAERAAYGAIKRESEELEARFKEVLKNITEHSTWSKSDSWWKKVREWLEDYYWEECDQLLIPEAFDPSGFHLMGRDGKMMKSNYLWERWNLGQGRGIFQEDEKPTGIWTLSWIERKALIEKWTQEWLQPQLDLLQSTMESLQKNTEALQDLRRGNDLRVLESATIIGCTTVTAAKYQGLINPTVVIVEEAGEILESHVLANLGHFCEQLVMIGDHKQLRPKIDNYRLQKESRNGFDLNVSLFERLVIASETEIPVIPLTVQHRMRPEISSLIRGMALYDKLEDHDNTKGRKHVVGVSKDVVFVDHRHPEQQDEATAALGMETKINSFEVDMVVAIAKYVIQQGQYSAEQVTILTPYLGQLSLIRNKLEQSNIASFLSDTDFNDMAQKDLTDGSGTPSNHKIRIATVDNFQGEESDIIIVSLVRSNSRDGRIGFLASEERANVLFSRAREGMYVVGNLKFLSECSSAQGHNLWSNLKVVLERNNQCLDHFPAVCQKHNTLQNIRTPSDFATLVPDGGCTKRCPLMLDCNHQCPKHCHNNIDHVHALVKCEELVEDVCSNGHKQLRKCHADVICNELMKWQCPRGHSVLGVCKKGRPKICKTCKKLDKLEEDARELAQHEETCMLEQEQLLLESKSQLSMTIKSQEMASKLEMMKREHLLIEKELSTRSAQPKADLSLRGTSEKHHRVLLGDVGSYDDGIDGANTESSDDEGSKVLLDVENVGKKVESDKKQQVDLTGTPHDEDAGIQLKRINDNSNASVEPSIRPDAVDNRSVASSKRIKVKYNNSNESHLSSGTSALLRNADFIDALHRFEAKNFLEADDLIDNCVKSKWSKQEKEALVAFRYIIHNLLDPSSEKLENLVSNPIDRPTSFEGAIHCWASFVSLSSEYPWVAKERADHFLAYQYTGDFVVANSVLEIGRQRAAIVIEEGRKQMRSPTASHQPSKEIEEEKIKKEWKGICKRDKHIPAVVNDEVMKLTGLLEIKRALVDQYNRIIVAQRQRDVGASSYNVRFEGNPGTGKTTIARHYSTFLQELHVLPEESMTFDVPAATLINKGVSHLEEMLEKIKDKGGGVIFIDEAYQLCNEKAGERILDFILPLAEALDGEYGKLVWIFAGYPKEMEKLFEHNVGLPSRFPQVFKFTDYSASEMQSIFHGLMKYKDKPKAETASSKQNSTTSFISTRSRYQSGGAGRNKKTAYDCAHGDTCTDKFGTKWSCDRDNTGLWVDEYGNSAGYHPDDIGSSDNPLTRLGLLWYHDGNSWSSNKGGKQTHYPGSPESKSKKALRQPPFVVEDEKYLRIAMRRLERQSNRPGFGNARTVRTLFDTVRERQARRITSELIRRKPIDDFLFTKEDLLGPSLNEIQLRASDAYLELKKMEGLLPVKEQIESLITLVASNKLREYAEKPVLEIMLNRVFLGNPGTGKTTVAKHYGRVLADMGLLSKGEVLVKNPSDFRGSVLGSSEKNTRDILRAAEGNVLVIDEAYALCSSNGLSGTSDPYGTAVIDTLVEQIQARPGDDRAVVMLGYRKEMEEMFKNVNPGLSRRFQLEQAYEFPDYDDASLLKILRAKARKSGLEIPLSVAKQAVRSLARARARPNFGNGGAVDSLLSQAKERLQKRGGISDILGLEDFALDDTGLDEASLGRLFEDLIGMDSVMTQLEELKSTIKFAKARGENPADSVSFNYLFLGNPGTGKTTVARLMGKMFKMLGLLPDDEVHEVSPKDLITGFVGQAGKKTMEILEKSRGGVLFIDEAYQLNPNRGGTFMTEAVDELCAKLTDTEFKGKLLVLLAGYDADMGEMLKINPGLKSRFTERLTFDDLSIEATRDLIILKLQKKKIPLTAQDAKSDELLSLARKLVESKDFANGRDVDTVGDRTYAELAKRSSSRTTATVLDDVRNAVNSLLLSRQPQKNGKSCVTLDFPNQQTASSSENQPDLDLTVEEDIEIEEEENEQDGIEEEEDEGNTKEENPFSSLKKSYATKLQDIIEALNLNTEEGVQKILSSNQFDKELIQQLMDKLGISEDTARSFIDDWRKAHEELKRQKLKAKTKFKGMEAIWHCAVCGRGGHPQPVCYFAPYISGYRSVPI